MSRNQSNIPPLLAARVRSPRAVRPPAADRRPRGLRLVFDAEPCLESAPARPDGRGSTLLKAAGELAAVLAGLNEADAAMSEIQELLNGLDKSLSAQFRRASRDPVSAATHFYTNVNSVLAAVDRAAGRQCDGRRLLDGACVLRATGLDGRIEELHLPDLSASELGHAEIGRLSSLRRVDLVIADATQQQLIAALVLASLRQVEDERRRLAGFIGSAAGPMLDELKVALENAAAGLTTAGDSDFAAAVGRIQPLEILARRLSAQGSTARRPATGPRVLRVSRDGQDTTV